MSKNDEYAVEMAILLLRKMADKMEAEPDFAEQLLNEVKVLRKKKDQAAPKTVPGNKKTVLKEKAGTALIELPDIYAVYMDGQAEGLSGCLEGYELDILKSIVVKNHLDPSGKVIKRKSKPNMIKFIIETTQKRLSQGEAFKSE